MVIGRAVLRYLWSFFPTMTPKTERNAVGNVESRLRVCRKRLNVMSLQFSSNYTACLTDVVVASENSASPLLMRDTCSQANGIVRDAAIPIVMERACDIRTFKADLCRCGLGYPRMRFLRVPFLHRWLATSKPIALAGTHDIVANLFSHSGAKRNTMITNVSPNSATRTPEFGSNLLCAFPEHCIMQMKRFLRQEVSKISSFCHVHSMPSSITSVYDGGWLQPKTPAAAAVVTWQ